MLSFRMGQTGGFLPKMFNNTLHIYNIYILSHGMPQTYLICHCLLLCMWVFECSLCWFWGGIILNSAYSFWVSKQQLINWRSSTKEHFVRSLWLRSMFTGCHPPQVLSTVLFWFCKNYNYNGFCPQLLLKWELKVWYL